MCSYCRSMKRVDNKYHFHYHCYTLHKLSTCSLLTVTRVDYNVLFSKFFTETLYSALFSNVNKMTNRSTLSVFSGWGVGEGNSKSNEQTVYTELCVHVHRAFDLCSLAVTNVPANRNLKRSTFFLPVLYMRSHQPFLSYSLYLSVTQSSPNISATTGFSPLSSSGALHFPTFSFPKPEMNWSGTTVHAEYLTRM